ncbi:MAG: ATP-grasp domain-containing protein [Treponema sp.]|nr:ATP-grasp domain-containing protein [Treponema sp.]
MKDSILILGAGTMQRPAILAAKKLGLEIYVVDANPQAPCIQDADHFEQIDLKNRDEIASYAQSLAGCMNLKAVFTAGTDFSANVAYASEKCGFSGHSYAAAVNASDKALMRQCFRNARVPSPHFILIEKKYLKNTLTTQVVKGLKFPYVVKPVDNMGARGCRMVRNQDELFAAVDDALKFSRSGRALLEEYLEGPEFSIDALIYDGTFTVTGFADRHIHFEPYFVELGHTMPTNIPYQQYMELVKAFAQGAKSLGLSCGAAKADIKWTNKGPVIGEIAARLSGGYMSGWTFPYSSDLNLTEQAIEIALGRRPFTLESYRFPLEIQGAPFQMFAYNSSRSSAERAWISIPGRVKEILGCDEAAKISGVRDIFPRAGVGDRVVFPRNNVEKCGNVISVAATREEAVKAAEEAVKNITIVLEKGNPETDDFLRMKRAKEDGLFPPEAFQLPKDVDRAFYFELDCESDRKIGEFDLISNNIPSSLKDSMDVRDWNHLSLAETIEKFDKMNLNHGELNYKKFWLALIRGGIQGALYVSK